MKTKSDIAMFAVAVGDALANAWGENDPAIDKVVRAVAMHDELTETLRYALNWLERCGPKAAGEYIQQTAYKVLARAEANL